MLVAIAPAGDSRIIKKKKKTKTLSDVKYLNYSMCFNQLAVLFPGKAINLKNHHRSQQTSASVQDIRTKSPLSRLKAAVTYL